MLVSDVAGRVQNQLGDVNGLQITPAQINTWVNEAVKEVANATNALETRATADIVANQSEYDLPSDFSSILNVRYDGMHLKALTIQEADTLIPDHDNESVKARVGTPACYWIYADTLVLYPTPDKSGTGKLRIYYSRVPASLNLTDPIPTPPIFDNAIIAYVMKLAYEADEDWQAAQIKAREFSAALSTTQEDPKFKTQEYYPHITTAVRDMGEDGFYGTYY